jgi:hypothetical protein
MMSLAFFFLCFTGVFVMFFYIMRSLEKFQERTRDEHAGIRVQIRALEHRLDALSGEPGGAPAAAESTGAGAPSLLTLAPLAPKDPLDAALEDPAAQFDLRR